MFFQLVSSYVRLCQIICAFLWLFHGFFVPLHLQRSKCDYGLRLSKTQASLVLHSPCTIIVLAKEV